MNNSNVVKQIVRKGYNQCARIYAENRRLDDSDQLDPLLKILPEGSSVLDLGCGAGQPITERLAEHYQVTAVDISENMIDLAQANLKQVNFIDGDISRLDLGNCKYDGAVAIFVLFHLPADEHELIFTKVWSWLNPGGYFLVTLTEKSRKAYLRDDFFNTRMFWSKLGWKDYEEMISRIGFKIQGEKIYCHRYDSNYREIDQENPLVLLQKPVDFTCS